LVTAGKHVNNIRAIARQPPITTIEERLGAVFSVGSAPGVKNEDPPGRQRELRELVEGWQFSSALQGRLRRDGAIVESSVAGYSPDRKNLSARSCRISNVKIRYQETAVEDTAGWRRFNVCRSDL
jgi:hypothetical protein